VLAGDPYHYPEERTLDRVPTFEFDQEQTRATRVTIEAVLKQTDARFGFSTTSGPTLGSRRCRTTTS